MKIKLGVALPLAKAAAGTPLSETERKTLAALGEWITRGCPDREPEEDESWGYDETVVQVEAPLFDTPAPAWGAMLRKATR